MVTKSVAFRFSDDVVEKLNYLSEHSGMSKTAYLASCICVEYDRMMGNPELQQAIEEMKVLESRLKSLLGKND